MCTVQVSGIAPTGFQLLLYTNFSTFSHIQANSKCINLYVDCWNHTFCEVLKFADLISVVLSVIFEKFEE